MNHAHNNNRPNTSRSSGGLYRSAIALEFFSFFAYGSHSLYIHTRDVYNGYQYNHINIVRYLYDMVAARHDVTGLRWRERRYSCARRIVGEKTKTFFCHCAKSTPLYTTNSVTRTCLENG